MWADLRPHTAQVQGFLSAGFGNLGALGIEVCLVVLVCPPTGERVRRVQEKKNCPLRFYLGLNLSTRLRKSNFDYFATKCYGQLSIQWTIVHTMSISWTIVHEMDNCYTIVHIVGNVHS